MHMNKYLFAKGQANGMKYESYKENRMKIEGKAYIDEFPHSEEGEQNLPFTPGVGRR